MGKGALSTTGRLDLFFELSPNFLCMVDTEGRVERVNPVLAEVLGRCPAELCGLSVCDLVHPEEPETVRVVLDRLMTEQNPTSADFESRFAGRGAMISVAWRAAFAPDEGLLLIGRDLTQQRQTERDLKKSQRMFQLVIDNIPQFIFWKDSQSVYLGCNRNFAQVAGVGEPDEIPGKNDYDLAWKKEEADFFREVDRRVMRSDRPEYHIIEPQLQADGKEAWLDTNKVPLHNERGEVIGILGTFEDITERKLAEAALRRTNLELEAKNVELARLNYTISHDLKNPLVTIKNFLGLVRHDAQKGDEERLKSDLGHLEKAADMMHDLLDQLFELSRVEMQSNTLEMVSLSDLARTAWNRLGKTQITAEITPGMPTVMGDRKLLIGLYFQLLENAVSYLGDEPHPRIEVGMTRQEEEDVFFVRDNGLGIDASYHERVFGLFERLDATSSGIGVGLTMVKKIVEVHGGKIWVKSKGLGQGSTFCFTLPQWTWKSSRARTPRSSK